MPGNSTVFLKSLHDFSCFKIFTSNKDFILDVGTEPEKEQKQVVLPIPAFHCILCTYIQHIMAHSGGMQEWVIPTQFLFLFFFHPCQQFPPTPSMQIQHVGPYTEPVYGSRIRNSYTDPVYAYSTGVKGEGVSVPCVCI